MDKKGKAALFLLILSVSAVFFSGCTTFENFKTAFLDKKTETGDTIRIGIYEPLTGADSRYGQDETDGIVLANQLYPAVLGKKVELIYADTKSDLDVAETAVVALLKKNPLVVLGSYGNLYSLVANQYLEEAKIPGIAMTNTNPLVTGSNPYYFRVCFEETYQGQALARYAYEELRQRKTAILIPQEDDQAAVLANAYRKKFEALAGGQEAIAFYETYEKGQKSFLEPLREIAESGVRTVFLGGEPGDVITIIEQAARLNLQVTFLGDSTWNHHAFMRAANGYITGDLVFSDLYQSEEPITQTSQIFLQAYEQKYGKGKSAEARTAAALGFDAYLLALQSIERAGAGATGAEVRDALAATKDFQGASGVITFTKAGNPMKPVAIHTFENSRVVSVCTMDPLTE